MNMKTNIKGIVVTITLDDFKNNEEVKKALSILTVMSTQSEKSQEDSEKSQEDKELLFYTALEQIDVLKSFDLCLFMKNLNKHEKEIPLAGIKKGRILFGPFSYKEAEKIKAIFKDLTTLHCDIVLL